jgi:hypothetical protein
LQAITISICRQEAKYFLQRALHVLTELYFLRTLGSFQLQRCFRIAHICAISSLQLQACAFWPLPTAGATVRTLHFKARCVPLAAFPGLKFISFQLLWMLLLSMLLSELQLKPAASMCF